MQADATQCNTMLSHATICYTVQPDAKSCNHMLHSATRC